MIALSVDRKPGFDVAELIASVNCCLTAVSSSPIPKKLKTVFRFAATVSMLTPIPIVATPTVSK
jgi:hypothetical protein